MQNTSNLEVDRLHQEKMMAGSNPVSQKQKSEAVAGRGLLKTVEDWKNVPNLINLDSC